MAVVYVNGKPVDIGNERLNLIQAAQRGGVFVPSLLLAPGSHRRCQLPHVPGRGRRQKARRQRCHAAASRARLPDAGERWHRHRHE